MLLPRDDAEGGIWRANARDDNAAMLALHVHLQNSILRGVVKRLCFPLEVMLVYVRWYADCPLSVRQLEEMMAERGIPVDHSSAHRWAQRMLLVLAAVFCRRKHPLGRNMIDKSGANAAAVHGLIADSGLPLELCQSKYLNNVVEQDHRAVRRRTQPMLALKNFRSTTKIVAGIETRHMIKKWQLRCHQGLLVSDVDRLHSLAVQ